MPEIAELGRQADRVYILLLPCHLLRDLEEVNWTLEIEFPLLSVKIVVSYWAVVRSKCGQVLPGLWTVLSFLEVDDFYQMAAPVGCRSSLTLFLCCVSSLQCRWDEEQNGAWLLLVLSACTNSRWFVWRERFSPNFLLEERIDLKHSWPFFFPWPFELIPSLTSRWRGLLVHQ